MEHPQDDSALLEALIKQCDRQGYETSTSEKGSGLEVITAKKPVFGSGEVFDLSVLVASGNVVGIRTLRNYGPSGKLSLIAEALVAGEMSVLYHTIVNGDRSIHDNPMMNICVLNSYDKAGLLNLQGSDSLFHQLSMMGKGEKLMLMYNNYWESYEDYIARVRSQSGERSFDSVLWWAIRETIDGHESYTNRVKITGEKNAKDRSFTGTIAPDIGTIDESGKVLFNLSGSNGGREQIVFPSVIHMPTLKGIQRLICSESDWIRLPRDFPIVEFRWGYANGLEQ